MRGWMRVSVCVCMRVKILEFLMSASFSLIKQQVSALTKEIRTSAAPFYEGALHHFSWSFPCTGLGWCVLCRTWYVVLLLTKKGGEGEGSQKYIKVHFTNAWNNLPSCIAWVSFVFLIYNTSEVRNKPFRHSAALYWATKTFALRCGWET